MYLEDRTVRLQLWDTAGQVREAMEREKKNIKMDPRLGMDKIYQWRRDTEKAILIPSLEPPRDTHDSLISFTTFFTLFNRSVSEA